MTPVDVVASVLGTLVILWAVFLLGAVWQKGRTDDRGEA